MNQETVPDLVECSLAGDQKSKQVITQTGFNYTRKAVKEVCSDLGRANNGGCLGVGVKCP